MPKNVFSTFYDNVKNILESLIKKTDNKLKSERNKEEIFKEIAKELNFLNKLVQKEQE